MKVKLLDNKKVMMSVLFLPLICVAAFAQNFVSKERFNELLQYAQNNSQKISAGQLYAAYKDNSREFESQFKGTVFIITGIVTTARSGFLGDYVIELNVPKSGSTVNVVYPSNLSDSEMRRFRTFENGDKFEALVSGRSSYSYVDVICYKENNSAYTATLRSGRGSGNSYNNNRNSQNSIEPSEEKDGVDMFIDAVFDLFK